MVKPDIRFIQFPLSLLRSIHSNPTATYNEMLYFGICHFAKRIKVNSYDAARQIIYENYRGKLSQDIRQRILRLNLEYFGNDDDYNGFDGDTFSPDLELDELATALDRHTALRNLVIEFYQVHIALQSLCIKATTADIIANAQRINKTVTPGEPMPMVSVKVLFDFRDNNRPESDRMQFLANIAVRSIIGSKAYCKTNKKHIVCRMFGYANVQALPDTIPAEWRDLFMKYNIRYHIDKLLSKLELNWGILTYSHQMRGMYVALKDRISLEKLVETAEGKKEAKRIKQLQDEKAKARIKALDTIKKRAATAEQ